MVRKGTERNGREEREEREGVSFVLFRFVLFCFVLFCFVLFCFVVVVVDARKKSEADSH